MNDFQTPFSLQEIASSKKGESSEGGNDVFTKSALPYVLFKTESVYSLYRVFIKYCVFSKILIYFPDSVFPWSQCVYTHQAGRAPALEQNWQS